MSWAGQHGRNLDQCDILASISVYTATRILIRMVTVVSASELCYSGIHFVYISYSPASNAVIRFEEHIVAYWDRDESTGKLPFIVA